MLKSFIRKFLPLGQPFFFLLGAFAVWIFVFRGYFLKGFGFSSDAISYFEHICFFLKSLLQGEYSLWDPYWSGGIPNDFFLRRICPYNPLFSFVILFFRAGLSYHVAYLIFLEIYVFLAVWGMYLLSFRLTKDSVSAFLSAGVLLFSAYSTRIFDSYMLFVSMPLIWFFYFLISFFYAPGKYHFWGAVFCLMLLMTTYIPFYFLIAFVTFLIVFCFVYSFRIPVVFSVLFCFIKKEKFLVLFCVLVLVLVSLPGFFFFKEAGKGDLSLSGRHYNTTEQHALSVQDQAKEDSWAVPEEFFFASYFSNLKRIILAIVYVPGFAFILPILGVGLRVSRLMFFLIGWSGIILLMTSPFASPLYSFLRNHVFFFKYFRNLHFFLWFVLLPVFSVFIGEQFSVFRQAVTGKKRLHLILLVIVVHTGLLFFLLGQSDVLLSTFFTLAGSFIFFSGYLLWEPMRSRSVMCAALFVLVILQPLEVYSCLAKNLPPYVSITTYDSFSGRVAYQSETLVESKRNIFPGDVLNRSFSRQPSAGLYYSTADYGVLRASVSIRAVSCFEQFRFRAYDYVVSESNGMLDWKKIERAMQDNENVVWIEGDVKLSDLSSLRAKGALSMFDAPSDSFRILRFGNNGGKILTKFDYPRFLVWTDAYYPFWKVWVNGKPSKLYRVNGAYKGVFVPKGKAVVTFEYVRVWRYFFELFLMGVFYFFFVVLLMFSRRQRLSCE